MGSIVFDASCIDRPTDALFDATAYPDATPVAEGGRQAAWFVNGDFGEGLLRHYRRGGLVARFVRHHYAWAGAQATRSFREFNVLEYLYMSGLDVPRPIAAAWWRTGAVYRAAILMQRLQNVRALAGHIMTTPAEASPDVVSGVAQAIVAMHNRGCWHADLNAYNVLLDTYDRAWLIDFDKARLGAVSQAQGMVNLKRLERSMIKVAGARGQEWASAVIQQWQVLKQSS